MAYQPIYATLEDSEGPAGTTHSQHSHIDWIKFWLNSKHGSVMTVNAEINDLPNYVNNRIWECKQKIKHWTEKGSEKRVAYWEDELDQAERQWHEEFVDVRINLNSDPRFRFNLNGIRFTAKDLELLEKTEMRDFLGVLSIGAAFALIPDIKKVVDADSDEERTRASQELVEKRDKLVEFFASEEAEIEAAIDGVGC